MIDPVMKGGPIRWVEGQVLVAVNQASALLCPSREWQQHLEIRDVCWIVGKMKFDRSEKVEFSGSAKLITYIWGLSQEQMGQPGNS